MAILFKISVFLMEDALLFMFTKKWQWESSKHCTVSFLLTGYLNRHDRPSLARP